MNHRSWDNRLNRVEKLIKSYPFAQEPLSFYREILLFQKSLYTWLSEETDSHACKDPRAPRPGNRIDLTSSSLVTFFQSFLSLVQRVGTQELSQVARFLTTSGQEEWERLLESYWKRNLKPDDSQEGPLLLFFPKAFLQPYAELLAHKYPQENLDDGAKWQQPPDSKTVCPRCSRSPQLGILTTEGEGASRSLLCSLCATEWHYKRVCCPYCGEQDFSKLSYHRASDFPHVRVEVCEECNRYIKSIDLTVDGHAVPLVDEVASLPLDLWSVQQGYRKIEFNLVGM